LIAEFKGNTAHLLKQSSKRRRRKIELESVKQEEENQQAFLRNIQN
jgi:hypothetical protein